MWIVPPRVVSLTFRRNLGRYLSTQNGTEGSGEDNENLKIIEELQNCKTRMETEFTELKDKYMRSLAEQENVRVRLMRQIEESKIFAIQSFSKDLLEVADVLDKAVVSVPKESLTSENPNLTNLFEGLTMAGDQFKQILSRHGIIAIVPKVGDKFDPMIHFAQYQVPSTQSDCDGTIADVAKLGYKLHTRTIRAASVGVFKLN